METLDGELLRSGIAGPSWSRYLVEEKEVRAASMDPHLWNFDDPLRK